MEPTHYLYLVENPRPNFAATMTAAERELFGRHTAYYREHEKAGLVLMAGPALDDTYGILRARHDRFRGRRRVPGRGPGGQGGADEGPASSVACEHRQPI